MSDGQLVGRGYIEIKPSLRGFRKTTDAETGAAADSGARKFSDRFKGAGVRTGRDLGKSLKGGFDQSASGVGAGALKGLQTEVAKAARALSAARLKQQDEAGKVRVAEARLAEAVKRSGKESAAAVAAEERLATARRRATTAADAVTSASTRLKAAQAGVAASTATAASNASSRWTSGLRGMVTTAGNTVGAIGATLGNGLRNVATGAVAAGAGAIATALAGGLRRLTSIDEATARMRGLGLGAGDIAAALDIANDAAMGTAFSLNDMANSAAMAMTANITGDDLVSYLDAVKGAAAAGNVPLAEISQIFGKVATSGTAYTAEITQLADRQIPIWNSLSEVMGQPVAEVRKLASEGKIDLATFQEAVLDATSGIAGEMGTTLPSKIRNTISALGRLGQAMLGTRVEGGELTGGLYPAFKSFFDMLRTGIDVVTALVKPFFAQWTDAAGGRLVGMFDSITASLTTVKETLADGGGIGALGSGFRDLLGILGPVGGALAALGAGGLAGVVARIPLLGAMLPGLGSAFAVLGGPVGIAAAALGGFLLTGGDFGALTSGITSAITGIVNMIPGLVAGIVQVIPTIIVGLTSMLPALITAALLIVHALLDGIVMALPFLISGAVTLITGLITALIGAMPLLINGAMRLVNGLVQGLVQALPLLIQGALQLVTGLMLGLIQALPMLIEGALLLVTSLLTTVVAQLPTIIQAGIDLLLALVLGLVAALPQLITAVLGSITTILTVLIDNLPLIIDAGVQILLAVIGGLVSAIPQLIEAIPQIVSAIWDALAGVDWIGLGVNIIQGLIDGIVSMATAVWGAVEDIVGGIADFFPHSPAKRGPMSGRGYPGYSGGEMLGDFASSMRSKTGAVEAAARDAAEAASFTAEARSATNGPAASSASPVTHVGSDEWIRQLAAHELSMLRGAGSAANETAREHLTSALFGEAVMRP